MVAATVRLQPKEIGLSPMSRNRTARPDEPLIGSSGRMKWLPIHDNSRTNNLSLRFVWPWTSRRLTLSSAQRCLRYLRVLS